MKTGIALAEREFICVLCGSKFTLFSPDAFLLGENLVCEACLEKLRPLGDVELQCQVAEMLSRNPERHTPELEKAVTRLIRSREQGS